MRTLQITIPGQEDQFLTERQVEENYANEVCDRYGWGRGSPAWHDMVSGQSVDHFLIYNAKLMFPTAQVTLHEPWVLLTKRTNDPKLTWLEKKLASRDIPSRRNGEGCHAPILEVREQDEEKAWKLMWEPFSQDPGSPTIDDIEDDHPAFH